MQPLVRLWVAAALLGLTGCGDDDDDDVINPGDGDADADADGDAVWTIEDVDLDDAANQTSLAISASGQIGIAYYTVHNHETGAMCPEGDPPGPEFHWYLRYAYGTPGAMTVEQVDEPFFVVGTRGATMRFEGETPHIVAMSGGIEATRLEYCGANDLYLFSKAGAAWTSQVVVANSDSAPPTDECVAASASTFGWVVGVSNAFAIDPGGQFAIAWRDIHAGATLQRDDLARSDFEFALGGAGGGWAYEMIDCGGAAADYASLAFEPSGGLVSAWYTDIRAGAGPQAREGVWVGRRASPDWEKFRLFQGSSGPRTSIAVAPDGTIGVVWGQDQALKYAFVPPGQPLAEARIETASSVNINSGGHASIAYTADSVPVISHYRCNRYLPDDPGCSAVEDGPVWSWREDNGGTGVWKTEDIEPSNNEWLCGDNTQIGVRPDGSIVVAYTCQYRNENDEFVFALKMASRPHL